MCMTCGFGHILPYFYIVYMTILLLHRIARDDTRCRGKYGKYWDDYCTVVPWKLLPSSLGWTGSLERCGQECRDYYPLTEYRPFHFPNSTSTE
ncbi:ergosterol biosynthesis ERG4/ERG24 family-domain-containing protein [Jimgerdemannia flammicorona]|uniref:7-dehydrocholesterol reductase n=1 Tax=Jimgerdemannia flammicorona TaxID=994334 RepID=A0A433Q7G2_9FUNG|nr:ergosterol biosynthesis ERG4/ERG24 family-domain-containing protein [Jimgerdemannia flammicorona]